MKEKGRSAGSLLFPIIQETSILGFFWSGSAIDESQCSLIGLASVDTLLRDLRPLKVGYVHSVELRNGLPNGRFEDDTVEQVDPFQDRWMQDHWLWNGCK